MRCLVECIYHMYRIASRVFSGAEDKARQDKQVRNQEGIKMHYIQRETERQDVLAVQSATTQLDLCGSG